MERLTVRNSMGVAVYKQPYECDNCSDRIWRLPDYGNGSPTDRLAEYEELEEQGLILKISCRCKDCKHVDFAGCLNTTCYCMKNGCFMQMDDFCKYAEKDIEAKQALAEMEEAQNDGDS